VGIIFIRVTDNEPIKYSALFLSITISDRLFSIGHHLIAWACTGRRVQHRSTTRNQWEPIRTFHLSRSSFFEDSHFHMSKSSQAYSKQLGSSSRGSSSM
ncbi:hypothetical protein PENTCL1PPCAC_626, partial [Pristionchus entomophagus]